MALHIRNGRKTDLADVERLLAEASLPTAGVAENIEQFFIAENGGYLIGSIGMEDFGAGVLLRSLAVAPEARLAGVGGALVHRFLDRAMSMGKQRVFLMTLGAGGYFERFGFREMERGGLPDSVKASKEFCGCHAAGAKEMIVELPFR